MRAGVFKLCSIRSGDKRHQNIAANNCSLVGKKCDLCCVLGVACGEEHRSKRLASGCKVLFIVSLIHHVSNKNYCVIVSSNFEGARTASLSGYRVVLIESCFDLI